MCGIILVASKDQPVSKRKLSGALRLIEHRGPDGSNIWTSQDKKIALAHTRLSLVDLVGGSQPISNETNDIHIIVNGEFYDHHKIRNHLKKKGHRFKTRSDSEIVLHLYEEEGSDCLKYLRGEFAFIIWDEKKQHIFAARDRFGIKPLYYTLHHNTLYMASEIKAMLHLGVPAQWDKSTMYQLFCLIGHYGSQDGTAFQDIKQIPPGHHLTFNCESGMDIQPYWDMNYARTNSSNMPVEQIIQTTAEHIEDAVKVRLQADTPVGFYLSGGLDSSAVIGFAMRHILYPVNAFTITFEHEAYDEFLIAQETANTLGVALHPVSASYQDLADNISDVVYHTEAPFHTTQGVTKHMMSQVVKGAGLKAILNGGGADEIFGGFPHFVEDVLRQSEHNVEQNLSELRQKHANVVGILLSSKDTEDIKTFVDCIGFTPGWLRSYTAPKNLLGRLLSNDFLNESIDINPYQVMLDSLPINDIKKMDILHASMYTYSKFVLPQHELFYEGDRLEMSNSIEGRVPFLDHQLFDYVCTIPTTLKINGITEKYILREACRNVITDTVYRRCKQVFISPAAALEMNNVLFELHQDTIRSHARYMPFFDQRAIEQFLNHIKPDNAVRVEPVLNLLTTSILLQQHFAL